MTRLGVMSDSTCYSEKGWSVAKGGLSVARGGSFRSRSLVERVERLRKI